ncbi:MAG TPA: serine/threonine-protein kinase [Jiangellaceae bacterium]|nr:serine/threonine-protein kinase [Jiangellaceae bacterium]
MPSPEHVGPYRLVERIGEGGMGVVHLAISPESSPESGLVALKMLRPWLVGGTEGRDRFARELEAMQQVRGPRVAEVLDADVGADPPYIVTRYVRGPSLAKVVEDHGPLRDDALDRFAYGLAYALVPVHQAGLVHRDVKPGNVLLSDSGPVLIDFGLARATDATRLTATGSVAGTPGYLAPETVVGEPSTAATDMHGWAATVVYAATGAPPFGTGPAVAVMDRIRSAAPQVDEVPERWRGVVLAALAVDPRDRPELSHLVGPLDDPQATVVTPGLLGGDAAGGAGDELTELRPGPLPPANTDDAPTQQYAVAAEPPTVGEQPTVAHQPATPAEQAPSEPSRFQQFIDRLPRMLLPVATGALVVALTVLAPLVGLALIVVASVVCRALVRARRRLRRRREARGITRRESWVVGVSTPYDALVSVPAAVGQTLLAGVCAALAASAIILLDVGSPRLPLVVAGVIVAAVLWWGPGAQPYRSVYALVDARLSGAARAAWMSLGVLAGLAVVCVLIWESYGTLWWPLDEEPWTELPNL